jgi:uncharacterized protein (UPF0332 family)
MNGRDFLRVARALAAAGGEAEHRSAVSRAYYAAFHAARDLMSQLRFSVPRADRAHEYLYRRLNNCGVRSVVAAGRDLHLLRGQRNHADYDVGLVVPAKAATDSLADAGAIIRTLDALSPLDRVQIATAMRLYEQGIGDVTWRP